jgi:cytoskeleton protein RodZ
MDNTSQQAMTPADAPVAISVGATLAAARQARGASVEDVARALKLSVAQVKAIEADDPSQLPSAVFVRGFIRNYARLLKLDITPLLPARVPAMTPPDEHLMHYRPGVSLEPRRYQKMPAMLAGVTFVLLGLAYYEFALNTPPARPQITTAALAEREAQVTAPAAGEAAAPILMAAAERPRALVFDDNLRLKKSIDPASGAHEKGLHFLFNGESWVEVRGKDGKVVFSMVNAPGSERIVRGDPPFSLVIGGASGVELSYNGSRVDLASYVNSDVARLRLE